MELEVREELRQEEVGADRAMEEERVLADPAQARPHPPFPLQDGTGVDVAPEARRRKDLLEPTAERLQPRGDVVVVVATQRVGGDAPAETRAPVLRRRRRRTVGEGEHDHGARPGNQPTGIEALGCPALEVAHVARSSLGEPRGEKGLVRERRQRSAADQRKADESGLRRDPLLRRGHPRSV